MNGSDLGWVRYLLTTHWRSTKIVSRGRVHDADALPGFAAVQEEKPVGLVTYHVDSNACEVVSLNSLIEGIGIDSALIAAVRDAAVAAGCKRLWLITTNDNTHALRFYQKRGFALVAVHRNALTESRKLKPEISAVGMDNIPLRDEIELEMLL